MPVPQSTYRVQLHAGFDFDDAAGIAGYLAELGVSHLYTSPVLQAAPGSTHGYDVVDHRQANTELGGEPARLRLAAALRAQRLGTVVDIVPNHVSVAVPKANPWWWDVLTYGRDSAYASYFDIDWSRPRILLPVLGDSPDELDALSLVDGELAYYDHRFPLAPGTESGGDARAVHDRQHYELGSWRRAAAELGYRRFFDINDLAAIRVEDPAVFADAHRETLRWVAEGDVEGLRIDHPDGLADPGGYLSRLAAAAPGAWVVVEKILEPGEPLPSAWECAGTTGYDALREVCGLFVDPAGEQPLTRAYADLTGEPTDFPALAHDLKLRAATTNLRAETLRLAALAPDVEGVDEALAEVMACLPVYRSYLPEVGADLVRGAVADATARRPDLAAALSTVEQRLLDASTELAVRFQQTSGMVMAKGVEDTAFYRYNRFVALNEVGGDPSHFGVSPAEFHAAAAARQRDWPLAMTTLSTHDTKRSEDVRARLAVLSELPEALVDGATRWSARVAPPDPNLGHLAWQTLLGAWPLTAERTYAYLEKASREAKQHTSWTDRDEAYDAAVRGFVDAVFADADLLADLEATAARLAPYGWSNALGQKLLQLCAPGVPDVYQGTESWDLSLVDPDNRRPVDYEARRALLAQIDGGAEVGVDDSGAAKLLVVSRALRLRRDRPEAFRGSYEPLQAGGSSAGHAVAFARFGEVVAVATRLPVGLERAGGWRDTTLPLPEGAWTDVLTGAPWPGGPVPLPDLLAHLPVALLART